MSLTGFKILSFDCYGRPINWESGLLAALAPLVTAHQMERARNAAG